MNKMLKTSIQKPSSNSSYTKIFLIIIAFFVPFLFSSCFGYRDKNNKQYNYSDGIAFEIPKDTASEQRYTVDNNLYRGNYEYYIEYKYFGSDSIEKFCVKDLENKDSILNMDGASYVYVYNKWKISQIDSVDENTYNYITLKILPDFGPFAQMSSTYEQSVIQYEYKNQEGKIFYRETTGLVENDLNIWFHPPRSKLFGMLAMNPFPYIKAPYLIGNNWNWSLTLGEVYADERWVSWKNQIKLKYKYTIAAKTNINTPYYEDINCFVIESTAKSKLGKSYLTSYFNETYGFVKLDYTNIDGSKMILNIKRVKTN